MLSTYLNWRGHGWAYNEVEKRQMTKGERCYVSYRITPKGIELLKPFERTYKNASDFNKDWERADG